MGSRKWSGCHSLYSLCMYRHWCVYLQHQRWTLCSPTGGQSTHQHGRILCTKWFYALMLQTPIFLFVLHCWTCPLFPPSDSLCLPGRPIRFMRSKYWIRARVVVLFPHQYGIAGHSSQCASTSTSSSYETITWWPRCHMVRSVGTT